MRHPGSVRAQVEIGCRNYEKHFGRRPQGIWLPECAYAPGIDAVLASCGIRYFFLDAHGILNGTPKPQHLTYRPILTPGGVAAFARDSETGVQVWSSEHGYPGDRVYREFYRDLGYDGDYELVHPCLHPDGVRRNIGLKFHRVTGKVPLDAKEPYVPEWARQCASAHAEHFVAMNEDSASRLRGALGVRPVICAMYDAELFGHWWFEGIQFLEGVLRRAARPSSRIVPVTPVEYFAREHPIQVVAPGGSSWGDKGYYEHWLNGTNDWVYPHLHKAEERMRALAARFPQADGLTRRALNQAARELLLAQSSDWAFLMSTGTAKAYATKRTQDHVGRFTRLFETISSGKIDEREVADFEGRDSIFQEIDYRAYAGR
jgi:1,4-alpha-glucan branching enzyme